MTPVGLCLFLLGYFAVTSSGQYDPSFEYGDYCRTGNRGGKLCCEGRQDNCSMPRGYLEYRTLCYCDKFCQKSHPAWELKDCCPDYEEVCLLRPKPPQPIKRCYYNSLYYSAGAEFTDNCKHCQCIDRGHNMEVRCTQSRCLVDTDIINEVNRQRRGWTAGNVTYFWAKELRAGLEGMLGTDYSSKKVRSMIPIHSVARKQDMPRSFDWRQRMPFVTPIENQNFCNASWSYAIVSTFSDRLTKWSGGTETGPMSYQQHRTCVRAQRRGPCGSGYLTKAWKYVMYTGLTTEKCYPQSMNIRCELLERRLATKNYVSCPRGGEGKLYKASSLSRVKGEGGIMFEIQDKGPVIATMRIFPEFFVYRGGVYDCPSRNPKTGYLHSVKIVGWGEEYINGRLTPYWIAANSWGTQWGEDGYFRIRRGQNDCDIEEFILSFYINSKRQKRHTFNNQTIDLSDDEIIP